MEKTANTPSAREIAETMLAGFDKHYRLFREKSAQAKALFERRDWKGIQDLVAYRIFYRVKKNSTKVTKKNHIVPLEKKFYFSLYFLH